MIDDRDVIADTEVAETDIAIIGMAGKFPGAPDVDRLWERVLAAEDCLVTFDEQWLLERGVTPATLEATSMLSPTLSAARRSRLDRSSPSSHSMTRYGPPVAVVP